MKEKVVITVEIQRKGYSVNQCYTAMTIEELMQELSQYSKDTLVHFSRTVVKRSISVDDLLFQNNN